MIPFRILLVTTASGVLISNAAVAQIVPDRTLPNPSLVPAGCTNCEITGGTRAGSNQFHSFTQFSVPVGGTAYFNNPGDIRNIFARVTGRQPSRIDGTIRANGSANLFLLNPNGILFGSGASLNLGGSFLATTGDRILFRDGFQFSASRPSVSSLLTVSVPVGIQFGQSAGAIRNRSQSVNALNETVGLQVQPGQALALIGNGVTLSSGNLTARGGIVELGSIAPLSRVSLVQSGTRYLPDYTNSNAFADIQLLNRSSINTSGETATLLQKGGTTRLNGGNILLADESIILSRTSGGSGGSIELSAADSLLLSNGSLAATALVGNGRAGDLIIRAGNAVELRGTFVSIVSSQALQDAVGDAGDISITTGRLSILGGSRITASSFGNSRGGNITVQARTVEVRGFNELPIVASGGRVLGRGQAISGIFSITNAGTNANADAGNLTINTRYLTLLDGGQISNATFAAGDGGSLTINATESVVLDGASPIATRNVARSGIFVSAEPGATGRVGALSITTPRLTLTDRAEIAANNRGRGQPGSAILNVGNLTLLGGGEVRASSVGNDLNRFTAGRGGSLVVTANTIQISGFGELPSESTRGTLEPFPSSIAALTSSSGDAGDLQITTDLLSVSDRAQVSVSGTLSGAAGNLTITANQILLNRGTLTASTQAGSGAEIRLQGLDLLLMRNQSQITAAAFNRAFGGNVSIFAPTGFVVAASNEDNNITANAVLGNGGNIVIDAQGILGLAEGQSLPNNLSNDIDASSEFGTAGTVTLLQPDTDLNRGLIELPADIVDASRLVARGCSATGVATRVPSQFVVTGRGGLSPNPISSPGSRSVASHWIGLEPDAVGDRPVNSGSPPSQNWVSASQSQSGSLLEAQGWIKDRRGAVVLVAVAPTSVVSTNANSEVHHRPCR